MSHIRHNLPPEEKRTLAFGICDRIAQGELLTTITQDPGMPHPDTFRNWLKADPAIATRYAGAREDRIEKLMHDLISLLMEAPATYKDKQGNIRTDSAAVSHLRVRVNALRWLITLLTGRPTHPSSSLDHSEPQARIEPAPASPQSTMPARGPKNSQPHSHSTPKPPASLPSAKPSHGSELKTIDQVAAFVEGMLGFEHPPFPSLVEAVVSTSSRPLDGNLTVATLKLPPHYAENLASPL